MRPNPLQISILAAGFALSGCGTSDSGGGGSTGGAGMSAGGTAALGGSQAAGGNTSAAGGSTAATGGVATGGTANPGGGVTNVGGTSASATGTVGGVTSIGGTSASATGTAGGATAAGGSAATGGVIGTGDAGDCPALRTVPTPAASDKDVVAGDLIQFNDNGAWSWYQDERAIVDVSAGKLVIASVANALGAGGTDEDSGIGGTTRDGQVEVVVYDLHTGSSQRYGLYKLNPDDHNVAALLVRPDGKYLAMYAGHNQDCMSYWYVFDGAQWGTQGTFDWATEGCNDTPDDAGTYTPRVTYSNLWNMSGENKTYNFVRSIETSPNIMVSSDNGATWSYGGRLTATPQTGYVAGYYKYWGNGVDRVDFVGTEGHPREISNNLYHGYIKGGKSYGSKDNLLDSDITDTSAPQITKFTRVFSIGTTINGVMLSRAWNIDLQRYDDGSIAVLWQARADWTGSGTTPADADPDLRLLYARFDGLAWKLTYLGKAGHKLYADEQDYTGLGALHPNNPNIIYISTTIDPRDDTTDLGVHEIFEGNTCDNGATWKWVPITQKSTADNLRPIVPSWDTKNTALLWWKGTYTSAQKYDASIVGLITSSQ